MNWTIIYLQCNGNKSGTTAQAQFVSHALQCFLIHMMPIDLHSHETVPLTCCDMDRIDGNQGQVSFNHFPDILLLYLHMFTMKLMYVTGK